MASTMLWHLQNLWPFSMLKADDLKLSNQLVKRLSIPEQTKQFVFAVREPGSNTVVYVLAAQNLSEQSAFDAECLIKEVKPKAVVAQVAPSTLNEIQNDEKYSKDDQANSIPISSYGVLKRCLTDKINKEQYDKFAGFQVLQEIFGIGFYGHFIAAKRASEEVDSHFLLLESPYESACIGKPLGTSRTDEKSSGLHLQPACLLPGKVASSASRPHRFCITDTLQSQMVKLLAPSLELLLQKTSSPNNVSEARTCESRLIYENYEAPSPFAQTVYPLLVDLYDIFDDLPAIRKALVSAQEMLANVYHGKPVDTHILSEVHNFRIAVEGLRIALNNAAHCPISKMENGKSESKVEFSELPSVEKCHVLFAQALRSQARKFGGPIVAIVDAGRLAGLRKHWTTSVSPEIADLADQCFTYHYSNDDLDDEEEDEVTAMEQHTGKRKLLADKPVVAVGAGATAVIGATSLSSTLFKVTTYKVPTVLKIGLASFKRQAAIGFSKILGPSKLIAPGFASSGAQTSATLKFTASAEKIRAVTHSMIASAERTSLLAIRTSFYEIMRRRHVRSFRFAPWVTFGCSVAACSGLLMYGDGIECAAESVPSVPTIARLGRGLQSLQQASQEVRQTSSVRIKEALQSLMYNLKKKKKSNGYIFLKNIYSGGVHLIGTPFRELLLQILKVEIVL